MGNPRNPRTLVMCLRVNPGAVSGSARGWGLTGPTPFRRLGTGVYFLQSELFRDPNFLWVVTPVMQADVLTMGIDTLLFDATTLRVRTFTLADPAPILTEASFNLIGTIANEGQTTDFPMINGGF